MRSLAIRAIGMTSAAIALVIATLWFADGAPALPDFDKMYDDASARGALNVLIQVHDGAAQAAQISKELADKGYAADDKGCLWSPDFTCFVIRQHFTEAQAEVVRAKLMKDVPARPGLWYYIEDFERSGIYRDLYTGRYSLAHVPLLLLAQQEPVGVQALLYVVAVSASAAALLALLILVRGARTDTLRALGLGLGCWSASIAYLWLFSVVPTFGTWQAPSLPVRMLLDALAFGLLVASYYAYVRFWKGFPQPVTDEDLDRFLAALREDQLARLRSARRRWSRFFILRHKDDPRDDALASGAMSAQPAHPVSSSIWGTHALVALVALYLALSWDGYSLAEGVIGHTPVSLFSFACFVLLVYAPGLTCLRIFRYHRSTGSAEDCRKIEWIWASIWIGFVAVVVPLVLLAIMLVGRYFLPELEAGEHLAATLLFFGLSAGPLFVIVALAVSILYRGTIDPRMALRGVTLFTLLGVVLTLVFVLIERTIALRIARWWNLPPQTGYVTAGAIVAATFQPVRKFSEKHVTRFVERVLPTRVLASGTKHTRALAVIDISAYTALAEHDEQAALVASALVQKEARRLADTHGGRVVKSTGDGVIMAFDRASDAVEAVKGVHAAVRAGAAALNLQDLKLHSGLHWGEVIEMHDGDIYGQAVNLTARIADWAKAGEIGASRSIQEQVPGGLQGFLPAGPQSFKNVSQPVECLRLTLDRR